MNDTSSENDFPSDYQRAKAILKAERRVTASLLQRRLGIGYGSASQLAAELSRAELGSAVRPGIDLIMNSRTFHLLLAIWDRPRGEGYIGIADDEFQALLTADGVSTTVTIISAVGQATGPHRASLAVRNAVGTSEEFAQAINGAKKLVVLVGAAPAALKGRELKIILCELRGHVDESCSISLGIQYLEPSEDDVLFVTVIFS